MNTTVDIVIDLAFGDSAKGKIVFHTLTHGKYTHVSAVSGGPNKGHAVYDKGKKYVLHQIPCGFFRNVDSVISSGCVIDVSKLFREADELENQGLKVYDKLKVAYNAHIITKDMVLEDNGGGTIGSTGCGIMQAYRAKYGRTGIRAEKIKELQPFLIDPIEEFSKRSCRILVEGAQGTMLCPDWGDKYPFVTSGIPTSAYALHSLGLSPRNLNKVIGCMKAYNTYSGNREDFEVGTPKDLELYKKIAELGNEYGNTTGRARKICWNDTRQLRRAVILNGCHEIVVSKMDILQKLDMWKLIDHEGRLLRIKGEEEYKTYLRKFFEKLGVRKIHFSYSPECI